MSPTKNFKPGIKLAALSTLAFSGSLLTQDIGDAVCVFLDESEDFANVVIGAALLMGIALGVTSAWKVKAYTEKIQQERLIKPITYFFLCHVLKAKCKSWLEKIRKAL